MFRVTALLLVAIAMQSAAIAQDAKQDTIQVRRQPSLAQVGPCAGELFNERHQAVADLLVARNKFRETVPVPPRPRKKPEGTTSSKLPAIRGQSSGANRSKYRSMKPMTCGYKQRTKGGTPSRNLREKKSYKSQTDTWGNFSMGPIRPAIWRHHGVCASWTTRSVIWLGRCSSSSLGPALA
jgi:hypothetical protein